MLYPLSYGGLVESDLWPVVTLQSTRKRLGRNGDTRNPPVVGVPDTGREGLTEPIRIAERILRSPASVAGNCSAADTSGVHPARRSSMVSEPLTVTRRRGTPFRTPRRQALS